MLKDTILTYHDSDQDGAKTLGTIDLRNCKYVAILILHCYPVYVD